MATTVLSSASLVLVAAFATLAGAQQGGFVCPHDYGFYAHDLSCDKYWACDLGTATLKTCGNGLAFVDTDPENLKEDCDYLHNVACGARSQLGAISREELKPDKLTSLGKLTVKPLKKHTKIQKDWRSESKPLFSKTTQLNKEKSGIINSKSILAKNTRKKFHLRPKRSSEVFECPSADGFYAHDEQCDAYWSCLNWEPQLRLCGNGLAFDASRNSTTKEHCDYLFAVDCGHRVLLEPPISTPNCKYLHGVFPDDVDCQVFYSCWGGDATRYQCGPGLAYDRRSRTCSWMDKVSECKQQRADAQALTGIQCPASGTVSAIGSFSRHAHPDDCRLYYVCFDSVPREYGCPIGTVFQIGATEGEGQCAAPKLVAGCEDYYGDIDISVLKTLGL